MGMDLYGENPSSEKGKYFRNNVWWWRGVADYVLEQHPEIAEHCKEWYSNGGDGLNEKQSKELARALFNDIDCGKVKSHALKFSRETVQDDMNTWYKFSEENIINFAEFLESCGGFKIY